MARILIVEDEQKLREVMAVFLKTEGFYVDTAESGEEAMDLFARFSYDLIVLDAMLPGMSGFDVCKKIRETSDVLIVFLTALNDDDHHMLAYRLGADDYLAKPFKISILAMKIKRMLKDSGTTQLRFAEIELDPETWKCRVSGEEVNLTQKEFSLLEILMRNPGRVFKRDYFLKNIWGYDFIGDIRVVDTVVKNLRKKLGSSARCIRTVISVGYRLEEPQ